jgi:hypothetical protein
MTLFTNEETPIIWWSDPETAGSYNIRIQLRP